MTPDEFEFTVARRGVEDEVNKILRLRNALRQAVAELDVGKNAATQRSLATASDRLVGLGPESLVESSGASCLFGEDY